MAITIKTPEEIEKMRVAGRLAAEVLDMSSRPHVKPGVTTEELDRICHDHIVNVQKAHPGATLGYTRLPEVDLHLGQPRRLPRHPERAKVAEGRRHRQHRRHRDQGRLARRHQPHVHRRQAIDRRPSALVDVTYEAMWRGIGTVQARRAPGRHRRAPSSSFAESERLLGRARVLRPRHRPQLPRGAAGAALRPRRARASS